MGHRHLGIPPSLPFRFALAFAHLHMLSKSTDRLRHMQATAPGLHIYYMHWLDVVPLDRCVLPHLLIPSQARRRAGDTSLVAVALFRLLLFSFRRGTSVHVEVPCGDAEWPSGIREPCPAGAAAMTRPGCLYPVSAVQRSDSGGNRYVLAVMLCGPCFSRKPAHGSNRRIVRCWCRRNLRSPGECYFGRHSETGTEHAFRWSHVPHFDNRHLAVLDAARL